MQRMQVLKNIWYCAALSEELTDKPLGRVICGMPMVLFRGASGAVAALEDRCPHRQAPLSMGNVLGDSVQCNYHGFVFDRSGACTHIPRQDGIPSSCAVAAFAAAERSGFVWIWWGDRARADLSAVPEFPWTAERGRRTKYFYFHVDASFQLMADNLLDISHVDFLHKHSIASKIDPTAKEAATPKVTIETKVDGDSVETVRTVHNTMLAGLTAKWHGSDGPVTRISTGKWQPPNSCILRLELAETDGTVKETINMEHIMTPESDGTCHYFMEWTWDFGGPEGYPNHDDVDREQRSLIEGDDIPMVEAQQRNIDRFGPLKDVPVKQDRHVNEVHRMLKRLYADAGITARSEVGRLAAE